MLCLIADRVPRRFNFQMQLGPNLIPLVVVSINNKMANPVYLIAYTSLFDLTCRAKADIKVPQVFAIEAGNPLFDNGILTMTDINSSSIIAFDSTIPSTLLPELDKWRSQFDGIDWDFMYDHSMQFAYSSIVEPIWKQFQAIA